MLKIFEEMSGKQLNPELINVDFLVSSKELTDNALEDVIQNAVLATIEKSRENDIALRPAAYAVALQRIYENMRYNAMYSS